MKILKKFKSECLSVYSSGTSKLLDQSAENLAQGCQIILGLGV